MRLSGLEPLASISPLRAVTFHVSMYCLSVLVVAHKVSYIYIYMCVEKICDIDIESQS